MTLNEAIKHAEEVAEGKEQDAELFKKVKATDEYINKCLKCAEEYRQLAEWLKELKQLREQSRWIPVSERLPEICEEDAHGNITFSRMVLSCRKYGNGYMHVGLDMYTTNNNGGWLSEVHFDDPDERCKVLAWMPLPEPYKEDNNE